MQLPEQPVMSDPSRVLHDLVLLQSSRETQGHLYYLIERDDIELLRSAAGEWIRCLYALDWREFRMIGAHLPGALGVQHSGGETACAAPAV